MKSITRKPRPQQLDTQKKQREILIYVRNYYSKWEKFPAVTDVALATGYGIGTVGYHLKQLEKQNLIRRPTLPKRKGKESEWFIPKKARKTQRSRTVDLREAIIKVMGGRCGRCGYNVDIRALQIDHVNGGGGREVREEGGSYQMMKRIYLRLTNGELVKDYQILCANCNMIKKSENREFRGPAFPKFNN